MLFMKRLLFAMVVGSVVHFIAAFPIALMLNALNMDPGNDLLLPKLLWVGWIVLFCVLGLVIFPKEKPPGHSDDA